MKKIKSILLFIVLISSCSKIEEDIFIGEWVPKQDDSLNTVHHNIFYISTTNLKKETSACRTIKYTDKYVTTFYDAPFKQLTGIVNKNNITYADTLRIITDSSINCIAKEILYFEIKAIVYNDTMYETGNYAERIYRGNLLETGTYTAKFVKRIKPYVF